MNTLKQRKTTSSLKTSKEEKTQLEQEAEALGLTLSQYLYFLINKGRNAVSSDNLFAQLKRLTQEIEIIKQQLNATSNSLNAFSLYFIERERVNVDTTLETMKAAFETRAIARRLGADSVNIGADEIGKIIALIDKHFAENVKPKIFGGLK